MLTLCWAAKGGSGTTAIAIAHSLAVDRPTLLVDLAGDAAPALGLPDADLPQLSDWMASNASAERLRHLERPVTSHLALLPTDAPIAPHSRVDRWSELVAFVGAQRENRDVVVDAGTGTPPEPLAELADRSLLVTRACYLALRRATGLGVRPTGVVLVEEPGRALTSDDVESALGAPVVARVLLDPKIARAIDAGLSIARLPTACLRELRAADAADAGGAGRAPSPVLGVAS